MAPRKWDAYRTLNILSRENDNMTCVGDNRYGKRCRWDIPPRNIDKIHALLEDMETKPPNDASHLLPQLAELSLCEKFHQDQSEEKVAEWCVALRDATEEYEESEGLRRKIQMLELNLRIERMQGILWKADAEKLKIIPKDLEDECKKLKEEKDFLSEEVELFKDIADINQKSVAKQKLEISNLHQACKRSEERAEASFANLIDIEEEMGLQLEEERRTSAQKSQALDEMKAERDVLLAKTETLREQLAELTEETTRMKEERNLAVAERNESHERLASLQLKQLNDHEELEKIGRALDEAEKTSETSSAECKNLLNRLSNAEDELARTQKAWEETQGELEKTSETVSAERVDLLGQISTLKNELAATKNRMEETKLELENSCEESGEKAAAAAIRAIISAKENAQLLERTRELESMLSSGLTGSIFKKLQRAVNYIMSRIWSIRRWVRIPLVRANAELLRPGIMFRVYQSMYGLAGAF